MPDASIEERTSAAFDPKNTVRTERPIQPGRRRQDEEESLLEMDKSEAAKRMLKDWDKSWKDIKHLIEQWKVNRARSEGYTGVQLVKKQDQLQAYIPAGAKKNVAGVEKARPARRRGCAARSCESPPPEG